MIWLFLLSGQGSMNEFLNKRGLSETDLCGCDRVESVWHIVFDCMMWKDGVVNGQDGLGKRKDDLRGCWNQWRCLRDKWDLQKGCLRKGEE
ncbi:hypothetical protein Zmor_015743 [Zophobas morio]|uniref:Uncharacterized protein n=1 Tax=Zophobas morio TaxID=2755281 RepID=A0AA38MGU3_9CUCU|nr:hypothetical protein Zmor_015743 [Zophobas morio]